MSIINRTRTTAYHPEGNGIVERTSLTRKTLLKAFVNREGARLWDLAINKCLLAYHGSVHSLTGHTPHLLWTARNMRLAAE
ncbi:uncharacterized protein DC041_0000097 [Schistosoma bovis]|uniref:Integrase catalytic domain-containing protein n=1 Tax=Schistosoma bovis TaxID=6184 RepID=A0A430QNJ2_SCHBO|nr:uncharacterized protein DC041_0000097 [Schistosoma bovis]